MPANIEDECRLLRDQITRERDPARMLERLLALDRVIVEVSMRMYNVSDGDRSLVRKQNRHLHKMVREHFALLRDVRAMQ